MSLDVKLLRTSHQQDIVNLFNKLVIKPNLLTTAQKIARLLSTEQTTIDDEHEIDENVRLALEKRFESIPMGSLDASALLTRGPFSGKSLLWVAAYIGASSYTCYTESDDLVEGYRYLLGQLLSKADPKTIQFNSSFKRYKFNLSTLWLALQAHLKSQNNDHEWIFDYLLENLSVEELLKLNFNELLANQDRIAQSALALVVRADIAITQVHKRNHLDQTKQLLDRIPPSQYPRFFDFNAYVLDNDNLGMTTLCLAAKGDADHVYRTDISQDSPFISILRQADIKTLNFKAKMLKGKDKGKSPLWYAAFMLEKDDECYKLITERADFKELDFNDKAEDPTDKSANKSALWFVSHHYAQVTASKTAEVVFKNVKVLTQLDYNNEPKHPKDPHRGKSVLWNLGEAALCGKQRPFTTALKQGNVCDHNYAARAISGEHANKSVLGFALALAMKNNFKPLNLILRNIKIFELNPDAIGEFELEMLCHLAKNHHLYPLEILLPYVKMTPQLLNSKVSTDKSGKTVLFLLIELAWAGHPHFLKNALKGINCDELVLDNKLQTEDTQRVMKEMGVIVRDVTKYDMIVLKQFVESSHEELVEQLAKLSLEASSEADIMDYHAIAEPFTTITAKFDQLTAPKHPTKSKKLSKARNKFRKI